MSKIFSFEEQPFEAYSEFDEAEIEFVPETFEPELTGFEWEEEMPRGTTGYRPPGRSQWARRTPPKAHQPKTTTQPSCSVFLPAISSKNYEDYVAAHTTGRITLMINGRNSGGPGPDIDLSEAFESMQKAVELLKRKDSVFLAAWHFDPTVPLTVPGPSGVKTWGDLFQRKAKEGVKIRIIMTDFDPIAKVLHAKLYNDFLPALNQLIGQLSPSTRDNLKYIVSQHPATQFTRHVATHHQKFMVVKNGGATTAFCGGLDIAYMRTPAYWTAPNYQWLWHDTHTKLEGLITRDLEREFILRWNREKNSSVVPAQAGWQPFENLVQASAGTIDQKRSNNTQKLQMLRTVSVQGIGRNIQTIRRDDIWQGYLRLIGCATRFIYMENQYFLEPRMADAIVKQTKAQPELIVIIVVPEQLDDPEDPVKSHGKWLQHEFFTRLLAGISSKRLRVYTMFHRIIHSKLIMVDDRALSTGSANANPRGFFLDTELNVMLNDAETVKSFRYRLWSHNLGIPKNTVATWAVPDFLGQWDAVAIANQGLKNIPEEMIGEGVITFDPLREKGERQLIIHDVLTEYPDADDRHASVESNSAWTAIKQGVKWSPMNSTSSFQEEPLEFETRYETEFDPESFESELAGWKWEGEVSRGQSPAAAKRSSNTAKYCPPFEFKCDMNCPFPIFPLGRQGGREKLCDRILGAIKLAEKAAAELEARPLRPDTVNKFRRIFGQGPFDLWPLSWDPRQTMRAGDIVASRFRTVAKELQTRKTLYRCLCNGNGAVSSGGRGREEPHHPTETIVRDPPDPKFPAIAQAVLCKNEVRLCPPFWQLKSEWQEGTILHEIFHLCFGLTCAWFQHDRQEKKRNNAYCYEAFAVGPVTEPMTIAMCDKSPK